MIRFLCTRLLPAVVAALAIFVGYIASTEIPLATFFKLIYKVQLPRARLTPEVPPDMTPQPRPAKEMFLKLPGSGDKMPAAGLGMCCRPTAYHDKSVYRTVLHYLLLGGRHIDTAQMYLNHRPIGRAIQEAMRRGVPRKEIFVTTKVESGHFGTNRTSRWVPQMLEELRLDYVDLVLLHGPRKSLIGGSVKEFESCCGCSTPRECREQTWLALSDARKRGLVRNVGVSNFLIHHIEELRALRGGDAAPVAVNQLQYHPWVPDWQEEIAAHCRKNGIRLTAYWSLGGEQNKESTATVGVLRGIAQAHGKTVRNVMLRWSLQRGLSVIPGTGNPAHMKENLDVFSFSLTRDEMAAIDALRSDEEFRKRFWFFQMSPDL